MWKFFGFVCQKHKQDMCEWVKENECELMLKIIYSNWLVLTLSSWYRYFILK